MKFLSVLPGFVHVVAPLMLIASCSSAQADGRAGASAPSETTDSTMTPEQQEHALWAVAYSGDFLDQTSTLNGEIYDLSTALDAGDRTTARSVCSRLRASADEFSRTELADARVGTPGVYVDALAVLWTGADFCVDGDFDQAIPKLNEGREKLKAGYDEALSEPPPG